ncbi:MAG: hypothetical protein WC640_00300 [Candidatus Paceibacterota bacterium]
MVFNWLIYSTLQIGLASLIITASSTTGPALALNPLLASRFDNNQPVIEKTYSIERPTTTASAAVYDQIIETSAKYGLHADTALRIANCESTFRQYDENGKAMRGDKNPLDVGIFQINEKYHLSQSQALGFDIHKTNDNIEYAMWLMKKEGNRHWNWSKPCWGKDTGKSV